MADSIRDNGGASSHGLGWPLPPARDKFGLPSASLGESETERVERIIAVTDFIRDVYAAAVGHLGERAAKTVWAEVAKSKRGRPAGQAREPDVDAYLLRLYDHCCVVVQGVDRTSLPRRMGEYLKKTHPHQFPVEITSIEQRIRRLLRRREQERRPG